MAGIRGSSRLDVVRHSSRTSERRLRSQCNGLDQAQGVCLRRMMFSSVVTSIDYFYLTHSEHSFLDRHTHSHQQTLDPDFQCPVCLGYLKTTRIVKECLHRFCNECIEKCLRSGMKQCPQCRIYIPSRRSLRYDLLFV